MFLPIGFDQPARGMPIVTWLLLLLNVGIYVQSLSYGHELVAAHDPAAWRLAERLAEQEGGTTSPADLIEHMAQKDLWYHQWGFVPVEPNLVSAITYQFLHGSIWHLLSNCWVLWLLGPYVEAILGPFGFALAYLLIGIGAAYGHCLLDSTSWIPLVGASGSIAGVMGAVFVWYPRLQVKLLFFWFLVRGVVWYPVRSVLAFVMVLQNLVPWLLSSSNTSGIAYSAHLVGFSLGILAAWRYQVARATPIDSQLEPERLLAEAEQMVQRYQVHDGQLALETLLRLYPHSSQAPLAALTLGRLRWYRLQDRQGAIAALSQAQRPGGPEDVRQQATQMLAQLNLYDGLPK